MPHETPFENDPAGQVKRWKQELKLADKDERDWRERSRKIVRRYRDEEERSDKRYNILWANTETLRPQLYSQTPEPVVKRRFYDKDPVGRIVAQSLERGLEYAVDAYDFDGTMNHVVTDYLLPGRSVARVRYIPTFKEGDPPRVTVQPEVNEDGETRFLADLGEGPVELSPENVQQGEEGPYTLGEPEEEVVYEEARCEYVNWEDFRISPARTWGEVRWVAFRHRMTKEELRESFGRKVASNTPLDFHPQEDRSADDTDEQHIAKRATVWEIWNKDNREVIFIAEGKRDRPLDVREDPLSLENFFPCPEPLYSVSTNNSMTPIPEYTLYQDQAMELNRITTRIDALVDALKARGVYAGEHKEELSRLMQGEDNELIPMENWASLTSGSLNDKIAWLPIEQIAKVLQFLYQQRDQILQSIFQITGISDIMRGATDPNETRGAQQLKSQFGVTRLQPRQRAVQRFARDLLELKAEIMAEMFDPETLMLMTGIEIPPQGIEMMRSDGLRGFRIDVETDSTIAADESQDKRDISEMFQALANFTTSIAPAVQGGLMPPEAAHEVIKFGLRRFRVSRNVEEAFEAQVQPKQEQPDPIEMAKAQNDAQKIKNEQMKIMIDARDKQAQRQIDLAKLQQQRMEAQDENERHAIDSAIALAKEEQADAREQFGRLVDLVMAENKQA